jgi:hypothetical protein
MIEWVFLIDESIGIGFVHFFFEFPQIVFHLSENLFNNQNTPNDNKMTKYISRQQQKNQTEPNFRKRRIHESDDKIFNRQDSIINRLLTCYKFCKMKKPMSLEFVVERC